MHLILSLLTEKNTKMTQADANLLIGGKSQSQLKMNARMANRHGLIAGATGTGKTITMQILAEEFSKKGVPVLLADIKGDVSGLAGTGKAHPKIDERVAEIGIDDYQFAANPVIFWDLYGKKGHPIRATIAELGPLLLSNLLELNETQTGVLYAAFKIADDNGLLLLDLEDLQSLLGWMADNAKELKGDYGNFSSASIGAIQRDLLVLEEQDAEVFIGEPVLQLEDLMRQDFSGQGIINVLDVTTMISRGPKLYATFLLWLMSELFENLPEVGDADKPKFVMFFDEAHLLFDDAPKVLINKIEQVVRLIRSKGVGIYFVTQSPSDVPEEVLGQLGLKIQHALRAFTPKEKKAVSIIAQNFRANPEIDTETAITQLGTGEALVSYLDSDGIPTPVEQILIRPPQSQIGPISDEKRKQIMARSPVGARYDEGVNRESALELLQQRTEQKQQLIEQQVAAEEAAQMQAKLEATREKQYKKQNTPSGRGNRGDSVGQALFKSLARTVGTQVGRKIARGLLGSLFGGR